MLKYEKIIEYIKNGIYNGDLIHKRRLPSIRSISQQFNCSIGTVLKAYDKLEKEHIIYSLPKSGYYVLKDSHDNKHSEDFIIDFSSGVPEVETFPYKNFQHCLNKSIKLYKETLFTYSDPRGLSSLINALTKHLQQYQIFTKPENIIVTSGTQQALTILSMMPFPNGKTNVLVEQPTYYGMIKTLELNDISVLGIERGLNGINLDELEKMFKYGNIKFFYTIPRFHNPTGNSYSRQEKEAIVKMAEKYNVYIVEDDIAVDLDLNRKNDPMFSYDTSSKVIYLKSYSKILMPGLRVAALVVPNLLVSTFLDYKMWTDMNSPILSQGALEMYLKNGMFDVHKKEVTKLYADRMICLKDTLSTFITPKIKWTVPQSGYFGCLYAENNLEYNKIVNSLRAKNIELFDTSLCFLKEYKNHNYFRVSISKTSEDKIKKGIPIVLNTIKKYLT
ncbi:HTH-type transcriptional regulator, GntR family [Gottschalkia acidurici 9a]|uniref:HTH-type transcriptional regulator, GntR family n=1 Tax=Gottschalkia acidurici (strain ATCC 7906 / DSM 604 / BCRC 14475 / CIP 104303 / KCTC 5404 / NCIMB 10678 / 9a) TaxID=1128398 RepID=K0AZB1_GOTA9|nr:PLP-dependent aminotransferase family protein [Gottschalkia acidurici]AFS79138.1 HTH-type transcriptional regulator, GntR family [Gottschalkia acidurici 9a]